MTAALRLPGLKAIEHSGVGSATFAVLARETSLIPNERGHGSDSRVGTSTSCRRRPFAAGTELAPSPVDQGPGAMIGEQFEEDGMGHLAVENHHALDPLLKGFDRGLHLGDHAV